MYWQKPKILRNISNLWRERTSLASSASYSQIGINLKELHLFAVFKDATEQIGQVFKRVKKIQLKRAYKIENCLDYTLITSL
ncbi:nuclear/nucleolar GTPase 2-like [Malus sylvestris]|uniref:nuclear/nucleolar GTPase 2-like n=1 Tax=Malus sylvestris TaxID=3752 RepID=UPI0021ACD5D9|nr:nuclear/nucleolar GTPase 2-like [Malus sylvestris]